MQAAATSTATPGANPARAAAAAVDAPCVLAEKARQRGNDMYRDGMWDQVGQQQPTDPARFDCRLWCQGCSGRRPAKR